MKNYHLPCSEPLRGSVGRWLVTNVDDASIIPSSGLPTNAISAALDYLAGLAVALVACSLLALCSGCRSARHAAVDDASRQMQLATIKAAQLADASQVDVITNAPDLLVDLLPGSFLEPPRAPRQLPRDTPVYISIRRSAASSVGQSCGAAHWDAAHTSTRTRSYDYVSLLAVALVTATFVGFLLLWRRRP